MKKVYWHKIKEDSLIKVFPTIDTYYYFVVKNPKWINYEN